MFLDGDNLTILLPSPSIKLVKLVCWLPLSWIGRRTTVAEDRVISKRMVSIKGKKIKCFYLKTHPIWTLTNPSNAELA